MNSTPLWPTCYAAAQIHWTRSQSLGRKPLRTVAYEPQQGCARAHDACESRNIDAVGILPAGTSGTMGRLEGAPLTHGRLPYLRRRAIIGTMISDDRLKEFIRIWKDEFDEDLLPTEAVLIATRLIELYRLIIKPLPPQARGGSARQTAPAACAGCGGVPHAPGGAGAPPSP